MKKMFLLSLLMIGAAVQLRADLISYNITVDNQTNWPMRVEIWNNKGCTTPNGGAMLPAHTSDWWPTRNGCSNMVRLHYPYGKPADIETSIGYKNFTVYQNNRGEFHWK